MKSPLQTLPTCVFLLLASFVFSNPATAQAVKTFEEARKEYAESLTKLQKSEEEWRAYGEKLKSLAACKLNPTRVSDIANATDISARFEGVAKSIRVQFEEFEKQAATFSVKPGTEIDICKSGPEELRKEFDSYQASAEGAYHRVFADAQGKAPELRAKFLEAAANSRASIDKSAGQFANMPAQERLVGATVCLAGSSPTKLFEKAKAKLHEVEVGLWGAENAPGVQQRLGSLIQSTASTASGLANISNERCNSVGMAAKP